VEGGRDRTRLAWT